MYKNSSTPSFDRLLFDMIKSFGSSHSITEKLFQPSEASSNHFNKAVVHLAHEWQVQQTRGKRLNQLDACAKKFFEHSFLLTEMGSHCSYVTPTSESSAVVSLKAWTAETVITAIQTAYFGGYLATIDPDLVQKLIRFDMLAWQIFYQYPSFLSREMNSLRADIIRALTIYFETPQERRPGAAWFVESMKHEYRTLGFTDTEIAVIMMFTYWG